MASLISFTFFYFIFRTYFLFFYHNNQSSPEFVSMKNTVFKSWWYPLYVSKTMLHHYHIFLPFKNSTMHLFVLLFFSFLVLQTIMISHLTRKWSGPSDRLRWHGNNDLEILYFRTRSGHKFVPWEKINEITVEKFVFFIRLERDNTIVVIASNVQRIFQYLNLTMKKKIYM